MGPIMAACRNGNRARSPFQLPSAHKEARRQSRRRQLTKPLERSPEPIQDCVVEVSRVIDGDRSELDPATTIATLRGAVSEKKLDLSRFVKMGIIIKTIFLKKGRLNFVFKWGKTDFTAFIVFERWAALPLVRV